MFNTHIEQHKTVVTPVTRVIEKSITPDKVTEMYDKVREEVISDIIEKVIVKSDYMNAVVLVSRERHAQGDVRIDVAFKLNGHTYQYAEVGMTIEEIYVREGVEDYIDYVHKKFTKAVSSLLVKEGFQQRVLSYK